MASVEMKWNCAEWIWRGHDFQMMFFYWAREQRYEEPSRPPVRAEFNRNLRNRLDCHARFRGRGRLSLSNHRLYRLQTKPRRKELPVLYPRRPRIPTNNPSTSRPNACKQGQSVVQTIGSDRLSSKAVTKSSTSENSML